MGKWDVKDQFVADILNEYLTNKSSDVDAQDSTDSSAEMESNMGTMQDALNKAMEDTAKDFGADVDVEVVLEDVEDVNVADDEAEAASVDEAVVETANVILDAIDKVKRFSRNAADELVRLYQIKGLGAKAEEVEEILGAYGDTVKRRFGVESSEYFANGKKITGAIVWLKEKVVAFAKWASKKLKMDVEGSFMNRAAKVFKTVFGGLIGKVLGGAIKTVVTYGVAIVITVGGMIVEGIYSLYLKIKNREEDVLDDDDDYDADDEFAASSEVQ